MGPSSLANPVLASTFVFTGRDIYYIRDASLMYNLYTIISVVLTLNIKVLELYIYTNLKNVSNANLTL